MHFPLEASILEKACSFQKIQKEWCNTSSIVFCNEEVLSQQSFKDECSVQLKQPSWKGHIFLKKNAAKLQGTLKFLMKKFLQKKCISLKNNPMSNSSALALLAWSLIYKCLLSSSKYLLLSGKSLKNTNQKNTQKKKRTHDTRRHSSALGSKIVFFLGFGLHFIEICQMTGGICQITRGICA